MPIFLSGDYVLLTRKQVHDLLYDSEGTVYNTILAWIDNKSLSPPSDISEDDISEEIDEATFYNTQLLKARQNMENWYEKSAQNYQQNEPVSKADAKLWELLVETYESIKTEMIQKGFPIPKWAEEDDDNESNDSQ